MYDRREIFDSIARGEFDSPNPNHHQERRPADQPPQSDSSILEQLRSLVEELTRRFERNPLKQKYYEYLRDHRQDILRAKINQDRLLQLFTEPEFRPTEDDLHLTANVAKTLCAFGFPCRLYDNQTYINTRDGIDGGLNNIVAVFAHEETLRHQLLEKIDQDSLSVTDLQAFAAINYHLETITWIVREVCPIIDSPYRPR